MEMFYGKLRLVDICITLIFRDILQGLKIAMEKSSNRNMSGLDFQ